MPNPVTEKVRTTTRGFVELTAVSHLAVAVPCASSRARDLGEPAWEGDAHRLMDRILKVRAVNSEAYWRDTMAVAAGWRAHGGQDQRISWITAANVISEFSEARATEIGTRMSL